MVVRAAMNKTVNNATLKKMLGDMSEQEYVQFLKDNGVRHKATKNEPSSPSL